VQVDRRERGSVLLLVPAAVLVLVVLGAIAVDSAVVFLGQRELGSAVAAAANDAAAAMADAPFYEAGAVQIDVPRAERVAAASLAARASTELELLGPPEVIVTGRQVCVRARARVAHVFSPGVPGAARTSTVSAAATATLADRTTPIARAGPC
jgi:uncharacterized membrane protein